MIPPYIPILNGQFIMLGFVDGIPITPDIVYFKGLLNHSKLVVDMLFSFGWECVLVLF